MALTGSLHCAVLTLYLLSAGGWMGGPEEAEAGKVLGIFDFPGHSHFIMFQTLLKELAARGHEVTVVSHFPLNTPIANYKDISLRGATPMMAGGFTVQDLLDFNIVTLGRFLWEENAEICKKALEHPNVQKLINSNQQFDVVILEIFGVDCGYGIAWKFGAPVIAMTSASRMPWGQFRVGNPENPSYFPIPYMGYTTKMSFWERLNNAVVSLSCIITEPLMAQTAIDNLNRRIFGPEIPPLQDLLYNTSLILLNSHFSLNGALPSVPAVVDVGGMHVDTTKTDLPKPLREWLDGAGDFGAVYVSFGSLARAEEMPLAQLSSMAEVLGSLAQRIVWKCDGKVVAERLGFGMAPNIYTDTWIPQSAVLAHKNVRVFVAHGGLMGTQEAVIWGKPMVVVPLFADQKQNANNLVERGMAKQISFLDITEATFRFAIRPLLDDPSYTENARRLSRLFRDRPRPPLQEAVFWTEYVMRHRGAPHMQSAAVHLRWWQLLLVDVVAVVLAAVAALMAVTLLLFRCLCRRSPKSKAKRS